MQSILTDSEKAVVEIVTMKMYIRPALEYLKDMGFKMSERTITDTRRKSRRR
jgi:hypothetical protein